METAKDYGKSLGVLTFDSRKLSIKEKLLDPEVEVALSFYEEVKDGKITLDSELPYQLKHNMADMYVLNITDPECKVQFNTIVITPGVGQFVIFKLLLRAVEVKILNHSGKLVIDPIILDDNSPLEHLEDVSINTEINGKNYVYSGGMFRSSEKLLESRITYPSNWTKRTDTLVYMVIKSIERNLISKITAKT